MNDRQQKEIVSIAIVVLATSTQDEKKGFETLNKACEDSDFVAGFCDMFEHAPVSPLEAREPYTILLQGLSAYKNDMLTPKAKLVILTAFSLRALRLYTRNSTQYMVLNDMAAFLQVKGPDEK